LALEALAGGLVVAEGGDVGLDLALQGFAGVFKQDVVFVQTERGLQQEGDEQADGDDGDLADELFAGEGALEQVRRDVAGRPFCWLGCDVRRITS